MQPKFCDLLTHVVNLTSSKPTHLYGLLHIRQITSKIYVYTATLHTYRLVCTVLLLLY